MGNTHSEPPHPAPPRRAGWNIWQRLSFCTFIGLFIALGYASFLLLEPQAAEKMRLRDQLTALAEERDALRDRRDSLDKRERLLKYDVNYLEAQARSELDMQRPGEVIIRIKRTDEES